MCSGEKSSLDGPQQNSERRVHCLVTTHGKSISSLKTNGECFKSITRGEVADCGAFGSSACWSRVNLR